MIKTTGTLRIKRIRQSRNGAFCVADLTTDFGEFKVKDPMLDQFEEGEYEGKLWISEIYLSQYIAYGKAVTEIRARLHDLQIQSEDRRPVRSEPSEIDPLDEAPSPKAPSPASVSPATTPPKANTTPVTRDRHAEPGPSGEAPTLFDDEQLQVINKSQAIKLDATVDRTRLRAQAAHLTRTGYRFDPKTQTWHYKATSH